MAAPEKDLRDEQTGIRITQNVQSSMGEVTALDAEQVHGNVHIYQYFLEGIRSFRFDYAANVENFLNLYLGTPANPIAFGGREAELDTWLDDNCPYLMLAAPAGRGKSALLVNWSRRVLERDDYEVAFVPISIRAGTNAAGVALSILGSRLAKLHGESISNASSMKIEFWKGQIVADLKKPLSNGKKLLVIIDGLDEATNWQAVSGLFPVSPLETLKILVSACHEKNVDAAQWLRRLDWDNNLGKPQNLDFLSAEGLRGVLESTAFSVAQLSERVDIVKELFRLTHGDPLLVQLYAQDLWQKGDAPLKPEDLDDIEEA